MAKKCNNPKCEHDHEHHNKHSHSEEEKMMMAQLMQQQAADIENQLVQIDAKKVELQIVSESIKDLEGKKNAEMMVPIGSGVLAKMRLDDDNNFLLNVGANVILEKSGKDSIEIIDTQIKELDRAKELFEKELQRMIA